MVCSAVSSDAGPFRASFFFRFLLALLCAFITLGNFAVWPDLGDQKVIPDFYSGSKSPIDSEGKAALDIGGFYLWISSVWEALATA